MANTNGWYPPTIKMLQRKGVINLSDNASSFNYDHVLVGGEADAHINRLIVEVTSPAGKITPYTKNYGPLNSPYKYIDYNHQIILDSVGEYKLKFTLDWHKSGHTLDNHTTVTATTHIYVGSIEDQIKNYTIMDVLNRTLDLTPTRTTEEQNKYKFDEAQLEEFKGEESPEFAFTGHTLFEAMLLVAGYKGAFPELKGDTISFRPLWNGIFLSEKDLPAPIDEISFSDCNQYCTYLESEVQNLVGLNDSRKATVIEPYAGGYKTTRSGAGSEISEDTTVISTSYNLYQSIGLDMGEVNDKEIGDITSYVYEQGEYDALSNNTGAYPNSKAFALKWAQMGRNYTELTHRIKKDSSFSNAFEKPAIANIVYAKGGNVNSGVVNYIISLFNPADKADSFADLPFQAKYVPIFNARIKQYKDYFGEFHHDGSIKYNQTAELVDSEMFGEHLKQLIRKIGNATKRCVYIFEKIDDVPKVGTVVDGYSVYDVQMSIRENEVVATISYVKYAELSQYIGVKNAWKDSDVSTNKCYNRAISYNEFLLLSHDSEKIGKTTAISSQALEKIVTYSASFSLTCVEATGKYVDGTKISTVYLPVVSLAVGNSLFFTWKYEDNYSAGYMSEAAPPGSTSTLSGTKYNRAQKAVRYCDMYGRLETYDFALMEKGPVPSAESLLWVDNPESVSEIDYTDKVEAYLVLPPHDIYYYPRVVLKSQDDISLVDIVVKLRIVRTSGKVREYTVNITAKGDMVTVYDEPVSNESQIEKLEIISATTCDLSGATYYSDVPSITKLVGHSLPLKPYQLRQTSNMEEWAGEELIKVSDLLVEKNSSEALTFSYQLHYCTDNENFIIGSGATNFCSLIGGSAEHVQFFGFNERINIFKRRFSVEDAEALGRFDRYKYSVDKDLNRITIHLPQNINSYESWALMGKDKNGNWQIIFGENRDLKGSDFETELYLLPMHKLEDFV